MTMPASKGCQACQQIIRPPQGPQKGQRTLLASRHPPNLIALTCDFLIYQDPN